jgi:hypothetical protein
MIVKHKTIIATNIWDIYNLEFPGVIVRKLVELEVLILDNIIGKLIFIDQPEGSTAILVIYKARIKDLSDNKKKELVFQKTFYILKVRKYEIELKSYNKFIKDIISSIDPEFVLQLGNTNTIYKFFYTC